jgi:hypothetical protein
MPPALWLQQSSKSGRGQDGGVLAKKPAQIGATHPHIRRGYSPKSRRVVERRNPFSTVNGPEMEGKCGSKGMSLQTSDNILDRKLLVLQI